MITNTEAADPASTSYIPYFDKEAMLQLAAEENGQRVYQLLAASKHQASACLDSIPSLQGISEEVIVQITLQLLEKGWHLRIFTWLQRVLDEVPKSLSTTLIAIATSDYWSLNEDGQEDDKFKRKRALFCERYDILFADFVTKIEQSGLWDVKLERAYGLYLRHILRKDMHAAKAFRTGFEENGDSGAIVPYAQILLDKKHFEAAKSVLRMGWDKHKDIACLKSLVQLQFLTKNSKEAIPMYAYLQALGYPIEAPLGTLLRDYQFPRDFDAIEALGASWADHYLGATYKKDLFQAISDGMNELDPENPDAIEYELRSVRLAAIEFRNYTASLQFVTQIMELYEGGWEKRAILKNFFEKYPLPRVEAFLSEEWGDEEDEGEEGSELHDNFEDILSAHLYLTARFAITPERSNLIEILKDFSAEHKLEKLAPLMTDLALVHERITKFFDGMGAEFASFYVELQRAAIGTLHGEENYFAVLIAVLEGKCELNSNAFLDYGNLVAFTSAAIVYGADSEYTESLIEMINLDHMPALAVKQFAQLLRNGGYERYALGAIARGDLQDIDILSSLLSVTFSWVHAPEDLVVALTARPDFNVEFPVDIRKILADKLQTEKLPNGLYNADIMTLLGEAFIAYGEIRNGLTLLRQSAATGNLRARTRIAEYYLYQNPKPAKSLKLFEEIHTATKDPKFLADIARAKQMLMEQEAKKLPKGETYDASKLLELIKDLPQNHPDYLCTFLELSAYGNEEVFEKACRVLMFSHPSDLNSLPEDLFEKFDIRMIAEIDQIEGMERIEWKDMSKHLFYARTLAWVHQDDIEYALDYFFDMLAYLEDFQTVAPKGTSPKEHLKETISLRNGVFTHFMRQFSSMSPEETEQQILTLVEYDEQGKEIGFLDQLIDPFAIALIYEVGYFEQMFVWEKKLPKFYEIIAEIFETICEHPILAERYEQKGRNILEYQKNSKKSKKFVDPSARNSPTLLQ